MWVDTALKEFLNTGQFKKKVTLSHVYNEVTSETKGVLYPERLLLWSRHFATRSSLAAAARNTFPCQLQTLRVFLTIFVYRVIVGSLVTSL
jgi:hypothetical protein